MLYLFPSAFNINTEHIEPCGAFLFEAFHKRQGNFSYLFLSLWFTASKGDPKVKSVLVLTSTKTRTSFSFAIMSISPKGVR